MPKPELDISETWTKLKVKVARTWDFNTKDSQESALTPRT